MASTQRRQTLLRQRRRAKDEVEDDAASVESSESLSEASVASDADEDADADYSDLSDADDPRPARRGVRRGHPGRNMKRAGSEGPPSRPPPSGPTKSATFVSTADTAIMINGLNITDDGAKPDSIDFEASHRDDGTVSNPEDMTTSKKDSVVERRKRDQEDYRKKMESDPAFIPTRGSFFMHDQRRGSPNNRGFARGGRGGGRGRGAMFPPRYVARRNLTLLTGAATRSLLKSNGPTTSMRLCSSPRQPLELVSLSRSRSPTARRRSPFLSRK
jgi:hypothetical protein